jgi:hypothetical protein
MQKAILRTQKISRQKNLPRYCDLAGWLLREHASENWDVLRLPAIAEQDEGLRKEGEALWPERFAGILIRALLGRGTLSSIVRMYASKNSPFGVDSKPFSASKQMMFTIVLRTLARAAFANCGLPLFEGHSAVIDRRNYNLPAAIREAVLLVSHNPNKSVME